MTPINRNVRAAQIRSKLPPRYLFGFLSSPRARYQPETQFAFLFDRLILVNLYSAPTEIAKLTSNCE